MSDNELLLKMRGIKIDGWSDEIWNPIINGVDLDLNKGEILGLIGESGAGKSTLGLAAMGYTRDGCRISAGTAEFDGIELVSADAATKRGLLGKRIAYVAQSAAARRRGRRRRSPAYRRRARRDWARRRGRTCLTGT